MREDILNWLEIKQKYLRQLAGTGTKTDTEEWLLQHFIGIVKVERELKAINQHIAEMTIERDRLYMRMQELTNMVLEVVEAKMMDVEEQEEEERGVEVV